MRFCPSKLYSSVKRYVHSDDESFRWDFLFMFFISPTAWSEMSCSHTKWELNSALPWAKCNPKLFCPSIFLRFFLLCCSLGNEPNFTKYWLTWTPPVSTGPKMQFLVCNLWGEERTGALWEMSKVFWQPLLLFSLAIIKQLNGDGGAEGDLMQLLLEEISFLVLKCCEMGPILTYTSFI